jgi:hypothetical protein
MVFIRKKKLKDGKVYAYEVTSTWDSEKKQSRSVSKYVGIVGEDGEVLPKGVILRKRGPKPRDPAVPAPQERLIQDFGNGFFIRESIKQSAIYEPLSDFLAQHPELLTLMSYRLCHPGPMYTCAQWLSGNVISSLEPLHNLTSQNISRLLAALGDEAVQRTYFERALKQQGGGSQNVIIDATSLPNNIQSDWSSWGYSDGGIEMQLRFHCVVDQLSKKPLFYRYVPGNISDVSTLKATVQELTAMGVKQSFALLDSGYCSEENIRLLRAEQIDFLTRLPAGRRFYKDMILQHASGLEKPENACRSGKRTLFIARHEAALYDGTVQVYMVQDAQKKAKDLEKWLSERADKSAEDLSEENQRLAFEGAGIFILISSKIIPTDEILAAYYTRQSVEQIFGFAKSDLELLPLRCHSEPTLRGYLFLQFLLLTVFIEIRQKLANHFTVQEALIILAALKCKLFGNKIIVQELTKNQKMILKLGTVIVPTDIVGI